MFEELREDIKFNGAEFVEQDGQRIIKNVPMLGPESSHGYGYEQTAMAKAVAGGLYEGVRCFINHASGGRNLMELAGIFKNSRHEGGKVKGDFYALPDEYGNKFFNIAKTMPEAASCSHVADGRLVTKNGRKVVEEISKVHSVDLVVQGATTKSVFEGSDGANLPAPSDSSIPVPKPGEKQYVFIAHCLRDIKASNKSLSDSEVGAICFMSWQSRFESAGGVDTGTGQDVMPEDQKPTAPEIKPSVIEGGNEPPEERNSNMSKDGMVQEMKAFDEKVTEIADFASHPEIVVRHQRDEDDRQYRERIRQPKNDHLAESIAAKAVGSADLRLGDRRETDDEFSERMHERRKTREEAESLAAKIAEEILPVDGGGLVG
jgi:hypothetical protein